MTDAGDRSSSWKVALSALILGVALGGAGVWVVTQSSDDSSDVVEASPQTTLIEAESRDLLSVAEWAGTLRAGTDALVTASTGGTVTRIAEAGDRVALGDLLAEIDGNPVVALYGTVPQFRQLDIDSDPGADIRQLEENLVALGYDPGGTVLVDEVFTSETQAMIEAWETDLGIEVPNGVVDTGQIAFIGGPSEVIERTPVGSRVNPGQSLLNTITLSTSGFVPFVDADADDDTPDVPESSVLIELDTGDDTPAAGRPIQRWERSENTIELEVDVADIETFEIGRLVTAVLPDGQEVEAEVVEVSDVARTDQQSGETVIDVNVTPTMPVESLFSTGPAVVQIEDGSILGAVVVPSRALIALAEGGHAIEIDGRGLIGVEIGTFDDGWVEITSGDVNPGDVIVVAT